MPPREPPRPPVSVDNDAKKETQLGWAIMVLLLCCGIYLSVTYYGHQPVPNADFPRYIQVAREVLSFEEPEFFKRTPGLGTMQLFFSLFAGDTHPELTGAWLLNAVVYPLNLILLFLVGRRILKGNLIAVCFALLAGVNPWVMRSLAQPYVETTLIFFTLLSIYFMLRRSWWCYLFCFLASMIRYEGAALILGAFLYDMILRNTRKERFTATLLFIAAAIPLTAWLTCAKVFGNTDSLPYVGHFTQGYKNNWGPGRYLHLVWESCFYSLLQVPSYLKAVWITPPTTSGQVDTIKASVANLTQISQVAVALGIIVTFGYALIKRHWVLFPILFFYGSYIFVHGLRHLSQHRYVVPIVWLSLLICFFGYQRLWRLINYKEFIPKVGITLLQIIAIVGLFIYWIQIAGYLNADRLNQASQATAQAKVIFVILSFLVVLLIAFVAAYRKKHLMYHMTLTMLFITLLTANHFGYVGRVENGGNDREFKLLMDWYTQNTDPSEKLGTSLTLTLRLMDSRAHLGSVAAHEWNNLNKLVQKCRDNKFDYVAWDSRNGFKRGNPKKTHPSIISPTEPKSLGPFEFVKQVKWNKRQYINIFRFRGLSTPPRPQPDKSP